MPESTTPAAPLFQPLLILFSSLLVLVGETPAYLLSEPVSIVRRVRGYINKNKCHALHYLAWWSLYRYVDFSLSLPEVYLLTTGAYLL